MNNSSKVTGFGRKLTGEHAVSFAEMLLSGKPLARPPSLLDVAVPRYKAKRKASFGRNFGIEDEEERGSSDLVNTASPDASSWWRLWRK